MAAQVRKCRTANEHSLACGAPFLWGTLFGRTCWTCLNPPLCLYHRRLLSMLTEFDVYFDYASAFTLVVTCLSNPFAINRTIIALFDVESQVFLIMATRASLEQISMTLLNCPPSKIHCARARFSTTAYKNFPPKNLGFRALAPCGDW